MANDRMFIINKMTGHRFYIAKRYSGDWFTNHQGEMGELWKEYLDTSCGNEMYEPHGWTIGYEETDEEFQHLPFVVFKPSPKHEVKLESEMENKSEIRDIIDLIEELDETLKESGWTRDNRIDLNYRHKKYAASLEIYTPDEDEGEDDE